MLSKAYFAASAPFDRLLVSFLPAGSLVIFELVGRLFAAAQRMISQGVIAPVLPQLSTAGQGSGVAGVPRRLRPAGDLGHRRDPRGGRGHRSGGRRHAGLVRRWPRRRAGNLTATTSASWRGWRRFSPAFCRAASSPTPLPTPTTPRRTRPRRAGSPPCPLRSPCSFALPGSGWAASKAWPSRPTLAALITMTWLGAALNSQTARLMRARERPDAVSFRGLPEAKPS